MIATPWAAIPSTHPKIGHAFAGRRHVWRHHLAGVQWTASSSGESMTDTKHPAAQQDTVRAEVLYATHSDGNVVIPEHPYAVAVDGGCWVEARVWVGACGDDALAPPPKASSWRKIA